MVALIAWALDTVARERPGTTLPRPRLEGTTVEAQWSSSKLVLGLCEKLPQAGGLGRELLRFAEEDIRRLNGRVLFVETSSLPHYELTRRFYLKLGYEQVALLPDYYADGDGMVVFRKRLVP